jgi:hypothetical protein
MVEAILVAIKLFLKEGHLSGGSHQALSYLILTVFHIILHLYQGAAADWIWEGCDHLKERILPNEMVTTLDTLQTDINLGHHFNVIPDLLIDID